MPQTGTVSTGTSKILLEPSEAGRMLGISPSGVRHLTKVGTLMPVATTTRGVRLYAPDDVAKVAAERQKASR
jgi:DNA-binding transcriptional MerR regulator